MLTATSSAAEAFKGNGRAPGYSPEQMDPSWSPAVRRALLRNGYSPTPTNGKAPVLNNWPNIRATEADVAAWETTHPNAKNTGILTAMTPTVDMALMPRLSLADEVGEPPARTGCVVGARCSPFVKP